MAGRTVKTVSFSDNDYENGLHEYASRPERGPFSVYVKRLIEQDRKQSEQGVVKAPVTPAPSRSTPTQKDRDAARDML